MNGHICDGFCLALCGYRCVVVNLRVQNARALTLGLAGHVCELQLILRQFAELQASTFTHPSL
jgi:hypothetical protein